MINVLIAWKEVLPAINSREINSALAYRALSLLDCGFSCVSAIFEVAKKCKYYNIYLLIMSKVPPSI